MSLHNLLFELNQKMGTDLKPNEQGACHFDVNNQVRVSLEDSIDGEHFFLFGVIGLVDENYEQTIFTKALEGNLFGRNTGGSSIGYDSTARTLILFRRFQNSVDFSYFFDELEQFTGVLNLWRDWSEKRYSSGEIENQIKDPRIESVLKRQKLKIFMA